MAVFDISHPRVHDNVFEFFNDSVLSYSKGKENSKKNCRWWFWSSNQYFLKFQNFLDTSSKISRSIKFPENLQPLL